MLGLSFIKCSITDMSFLSDVIKKSYKLSMERTSIDINST